MITIRKTRKIILFLAMIISLAGLLSTLATPTLAVGDLESKIKTNLNDSAYFYPEAKEPTEIVGNVIKLALGTIVLIFFVLIVYAGFRWMTAGGKDEDVAAAKKLIGNAMIGVAVILFAYAITYFVFDLLI
jgi:hypothetical protein